MPIRYFKTISHNYHFSWLPKFRLSFERFLEEHRITVSACNSLWQNTRFPNPTFLCWMRNRITTMSELCGWVGVSVFKTKNPCLIGKGTQAFREPIRFISVLSFSLSCPSDFELHSKLILILQFISCLTVRNPPQAVNLTIHQSKKGKSLNWNLHIFSFLRYLYN